MPDHNTERERADVIGRLLDFYCNLIDEPRLDEQEKIRQQEHRRELVEFLLADLHHYCNFHSVDMSRLLRRSKLHVREETDGNP
jgi:hypothetical protein